MSPVRPLPFFILGSGRCGSTLLYDLLRDHPSIALTNEARILDSFGAVVEMAQAPEGQVSPTRGILGVLDDRERQAVVPALLRRLPDVMEGYYRAQFGDRFTHFGDKLPDVWCALWARRFFDDVRYVVLVRDPRDVVASYLALRRVDPHTLGPRAEEMVALPISAFATAWANTYEAIVTNLDPQSSVFMTYWELLQDPVAAATRVLRHLDLEPHDTLSDAAKLSSPFGHGTSANAKRSVARWTQDLTEAEASEVVAICRPLMERFGYRS
jgi:hypothetical protein